MNIILYYLFVFIYTPTILSFSLKPNKDLINKFIKTNLISSLVGLTVLLPISYSNAAALDINSNINDGLKFTNSLNDLVQLDQSWDTIVKGNGDNIRRKLGTVYTPPVCSSPLCGITTYIPKYVQAHFDVLDVSAFEDPANEFLQAYNQADFLAYSSMFADYGNGGNGVDYIDSAHTQIKKAIESLKEIIHVINQN